MANTKTIIDSVRVHTSVRASALELVQGIARQFEDALKQMGVDAGAELHDLLGRLKHDDAGLASAVVHGTVVDDNPAHETLAEPIPNPSGPTTVGNTVVNTDLSRVAGDGEVTFKAPDGTVATFPQVDPATGKVPDTQSGEHPADRPEVKNIA